MIKLSKLHWLSVVSPNLSKWKYTKNVKAGYNITTLKLNHMVNRKER